MTIILSLASGTYIVQFMVEATSVADGVPIVVPPPQGRGRRVAVGANGSLALIGLLMKEEDEIGIYFFGLFLA